jgi:hypothetical protein
MRSTNQTSLMGQFSNATNRVKRTIQKLSLVVSVHDFNYYKRPSTAQLLVIGLNVNGTHSDWEFCDISEHV